MAKKKREAMSPPASDLLFVSNDLNDATYLPCCVLSLCFSL
jgi:hypothetical protein